MNREGYGVITADDEVDSAPLPHIMIKDNEFLGMIRRDLAYARDTSLNDLKTLLGVAACMDAVIQTVVKDNEDWVYRLILVIGNHAADRKMRYQLYRVFATTRRMVKEYKTVETAMKDAMKLGMVRRMTLLLPE